MRFSLCSNHNTEKICEISHITFVTNGLISIVLLERRFSCVFQISLLLNRNFLFYLGVTDLQEELLLFNDI